MNSDATPIPVLLTVSLNSTRNGRYSPSTHADKAHLLVLVLQLSKQSRHLARTGSTDGVTQRNSASVGVDLLQIQTQLAHAMDGLARKRLIQLKHVDVVFLDTQILVQVLDRKNRGNTHLVRLAARHLRASKPGNGLQAVGVGPRATRKDGSRGAVGDLRPTTLGPIPAN